MLFNEKKASDKRFDLSSKLKSGRLLKFVGAYSPLVAMMIEKIGFDGIYVSGGVISNDLGLPDIGLMGLDEVAKRAYQISRVSSLPSLVDVDTGFGEPMSLVRTIQVMEEMGMSGIHVEDQLSPKRCGHLDHKQVISQSEMVKKIGAAARAKKDQRFLLMVRSDARAVEGLDATLERIKAYVGAGADAIFPEALENLSEFESVRRITSVPLLANMTEFGKSELLSVDTLERLGYNFVLYPVTTQRLAMKSVEQGLKTLLADGDQKEILSRMQTRKELYDLISYEKYNQFDRDIYNFYL